MPKLIPKKNGRGTVGSYVVNLGSAEVRNAGFINERGEPYEIEKVIDEEKQEIIIRLLKEDK